MRRALEALVEDLRTRHAAGETRVAVSDETLAALRRRAEVMAARAAGRGRSVPAEAPTIAPVVASAAPTPRSDVVREREEPAPAPSRPAPVPAARRSARPAVPADRLEVEPGFTIPRPPAPPVIDLPQVDKRTRWEALRKVMFADPYASARVRPGKTLVYGTGDLDAAIFFCGEAPGADEETQGEPFVGRAGELLTKMIGGMGLSRERVYISNIVPWRPEKANMEVGNRKPTPEEMAYAMPYLLEQVRIVRPKVIVSLGATAMEGFLGKGQGRTITRIRGTWQEWEGIPLMPTFHPSFVLQYATQENKRQVWEDLLAVMERVGLPITEKMRGFYQPR